MGIRHTFGLFVDPIALDRGLSLSTIAVAIPAVHNLVWGFAQPFARAAAHPLRRGARCRLRRVGVRRRPRAGVNASTGGFLLVIVWACSWALVLSCTTFAVTPCASVGRGRDARALQHGWVWRAPANRSASLPWCPYSVSARPSGLSVALLALGRRVAVSPLGLSSSTGVAASLRAVRRHRPTRSATCWRRLLYRGYILLTLGFFHLRLPACLHRDAPSRGYLVLCNMPAGLGATALALIGLFSVRYLDLRLAGGRLRQQYLLGGSTRPRTRHRRRPFLAKTDVSVMAFAQSWALSGSDRAAHQRPGREDLWHRASAECSASSSLAIRSVSSSGSARRRGLRLTGSYASLWISTPLAALTAGLLHFPINDASVGRAPAPA